MDIYHFKLGAGQGGGWLTLSDLPGRTGLGASPLGAPRPRPGRPTRGPPRPRPGRPRSPKLMSSWDVMSLAGFRKWWRSSNWERIQSKCSASRMFPPCKCVAADFYLGLLSLGLNQLNFLILCWKWASSGTQKGWEQRASQLQLTPALDLCSTNPFCQSSPSLTLRMLNSTLARSLSCIAFHSSKVISLGPSSFTSSASFSLYIHTKHTLIMCICEWTCYNTSGYWVLTGNQVQPTTNLLSFNLFHQHKTYLFSESAGGCSSPSGFSSVTFDWSSSLGRQKNHQYQEYSLYTSILACSQSLRHQINSLFRYFEQWKRSTNHSNC